MSEKKEARHLCAIQRKMLVYERREKHLALRCQIVGLGMERDTWLWSVKSVKDNEWDSFYS